MGLMGGIFGGAVGLSLGGPVGAIIGAIVGHKLGERAHRISDATERSATGAQGIQEAQVVFFVTTFSMLAKMAKADGRVSEEEIELIQDFMQGQLGLSAEDRRYAIEIFRRAKDSPQSFDDFARQFAEVFSSQKGMREVMLDLLVRLAAADGTIHPAEERMLRRAAEIFGLGDAVLDQVLGRWSEDISRHYAILGISPDASDEEIRSRYRRLVVQYHPDKIIAQGLPEEFVELAQRRFQEIQQAWEAVSHQRGIR